MKVNVGGVDLNMLIGSGATSNVIDEHTWESLKKDKIKCESCVAPPGRKLWEYGADQALSLKGLFSCEDESQTTPYQLNSSSLRAKVFPYLARILQ